MLKPKWTKLALHYITLHFRVLSLAILVAIFPFIFTDSTTVILDN